MNHIKKILLIRLSSLGDIVLTIPVIEALRIRFPEAHICYLTKEKYRDLFSFIPGINKLICMDIDKGLKGFCKLYKTAKLLRRDRFDFVIDLHFRKWSLLKTEVWVYILSLVLRRNIILKAHRPAFDRVFKQKIPKKHVFNFYQELLKSIDVTVNNNPPLLYMSPKDKEDAKESLYTRGVTEKDILVGICPGASWESKRWPINNFREVCRELIKQDNIKLVLSGTKAEKKLIGDISNSIGKDRGIYMIDSPIKEVIYAISMCRVMLCNDSGPMHVASALNVPVVALFGPTSSALYCPLDANCNIIKSDVDCNPCSRWGEKRCRQKRQLCFDNISVDMVLHKLYHILNIAKVSI